MVTQMASKRRLDTLFGADQPSKVSNVPAIAGGFRNQATGPNLGPHPADFSAGVHILATSNVILSSGQGIAPGRYGITFARVSGANDLAAIPLLRPEFSFRR
jgi:hypothetical protein